MRRAGSIPASAGEPRTRTRTPSPTAVYPRVCGGTLPLAWVSGTLRGLSPRLRGNPNGAGRRRGGPAGSIPASAGEPPWGWACRKWAMVYPRVCGGTTRKAPVDLRQDGLSPRLRGNHISREPVGTCTWSIPASAGEPPVDRRCAASDRVYPRVCGGTMVEEVGIEPTAGLSPRLRGNQDRTGWNSCGGRSIPASAGEPPAFGSPAWWRSVYPRVCGGTGDQGPCGRSKTGLSPRLRGNLGWSVRLGQEHRSIPASAGEPPIGTLQGPQRAVYPRVCGGTKATIASANTARGLSPRLRGNQRVSVGEVLGYRSIPASAGEPIRRCGCGPSPWVYPRVCGGTRSPASAVAWMSGLSPRLRGNLH